MKRVIYEGAEPRHFKRRREAAAYVRDSYKQPCAAATLATYASRGGGPRFYKAGNAAIYDLKDLDAWALARMGAPVENTSQRSQHLQANDLRNHKGFGRATKYSGEIAERKARTETSPIAGALDANRS
jgi:hypothetical protein